MIKKIISVKKEAWEFTKAQWFLEFLHNRKKLIPEPRWGNVFDNRRIIEAEHYKAVKQALKDGKPVSSEVLIDCFDFNL